MRLHLPDDTSEGFTRIPNGLFSANLPPTSERVWIRLASLDRGDFSEDYSSLEAMAETLGLSRTTFFRGFKELRESGCIVRKGDDWQLVVPSEPLAKKEPKPKAAPKPKPEPEEPTIAEEMEAGPRRVNTMGEKEARALFVEAWNTNKPEGYMEERTSMNPATWIAVEQQAKRLKVEREAYPEFVKSICRALKASDFWSTKTFRVSNVFGYGSKLEDKKFQSVEKLYKQGQTKEVKSAAFQGTKADFLEWYNGKGYPVKDVVRHNVEHINDAREIEYKIRDEQGEDFDWSVVRVYFRGNVISYWSGKDNEPKLYNLP